MKTVAADESGLEMYTLIALIRFTLSAVYVKAINLRINDSCNADNMNALKMQVFSVLGYLFFFSSL